MRYQHLAHALLGSIVIALSTHSSAQCVDWADGYAADELGCDGEVSVMLQVEEDGHQVVYVGGSFSRIGGIDAASLARWDGTSWSEVGGGIGGEVDELLIHDDGGGEALYVGGQFYEAGGEPIRMLARWDGTVWTEVGNSGLTNAVQAMAVHAGRLFVAGRFSEIAGQDTGYLASWDGSAWFPYSSGPSPREGHAMAYDAARGQVVLFSGDEIGSGGHQTDTWVYSAGDWTKVATAGPDPREGHSMAYDSLRQRVLLYGGGQSSNSWDSRLFAWDGTAWGQVADYMPEARRGTAIAYDSARDRVVFFGGSGWSNTYYDETWEFDGTQWAEVIPATTRPPTRTMYSIAYDQARGEVVMFGGYSYDLGALADTWAWDGVDWVQVASAGPSPRYGHKMVYDSTRQMIVMYGGRGDAGWDKDTWGWDGTQWVLLAPFDPSRPDDSHGDMAYNPVSDRVVMRDELGVTWLWDGTEWTYLHEGGLNGEVYDLASFDGGSGAELYACGYFTQAGAIAAARIARLGPDGWNTVGGGIQDTYCYTLHEWDDGAGSDLYIGGSFNTADNQPMKSIGRWDGSAWSILNVGDAGDGGGVVGAVRTIYAYDDGSGEKLYVGGEFDQVDGPGIGYNGDIEAHDIARWDGSVWEPVGGHIDHSGYNRGVFALSGTSIGGTDRLFAGGDFDEAGGKPSSGLAVWGDPCTPPTITEQPVDVIAVELEPVVFGVRSWGTRPLSYQWRKNGRDLVDDSRVSGATTAYLLIDPWLQSDAGIYDIVITNAHGSVTSDPAGLTTFPGGGSGGVVAVATVMLPPAPCPWDEDTYMARAGGQTTASTGQGVFWAEAAANLIDAYFRWENGQHEPIVKVDDPAPGTGEGVFFGDYQRNIADGAFVSAGGEITIVAPLSGDEVDFNNDRGIWRAIGDELVLVQREGDPAPGFDTGVTIDGNYGGSAKLRSYPARGGWLTFNGALEGGSFDPSRDRALWRWSYATGGEVLAQRFTPAPVVGTNTLDFWPPARIDPAGNALFTMSLESRTGYKHNASAWDTAMFLGAPGEFELVVKSGDPAPGVGPEDNFDHILGSDDALLSDNGEVAFGCRVSGPGGFTAQALYHWSEGILTPLAIEGQPAPGLPYDLPFGASYPHALNSTGITSFTAGLNNDGCGSDCPNSGFFVSVDGEVSAVAYRFMAPLPGLGDGFEYGETGRVGVNDAGQVIFVGGVKLYGVSLSGVFGWVEQYGMFPIAVPGSQLEVSPGDVRVVVDAKLAYVDIGISGDHLRQAGISEDGRFLFNAGFSDGTQGVFEGSFVDFLRGYFPCLADFNGDDTVNTLDVLAFLNAWSAGDDSADINEDGSVNTLDVLAFLNLWSAGC